MASLYTILKVFRPRRTIKSEDFNNTENAIKAFADSLGDAPVGGRKGVSTPFSIGDAVESYHAISKTQFDAALTGVSGVFVVDGNYTVTDGVPVDIHMRGLTTNRTVTLCQNPAAGQMVRIRDADLTGGTYTILVERNTRTIQGSASDLSIDVSGAIVTLVYDLANTNWAIADISPATNEA